MGLIDEPMAAPSCCIFVSQVNYPMVVLAFTPMYLLYLSILVAYDPYSVLHDSITIALHTFKMITTEQVWKLIQQGNNAFFIVPMMLVYIFLLQSIRTAFLHFVWQHMPYQWNVLPFGLAMAPRVFTLLNKPILFLCCHAGFHFPFYLDNILVLTHSKHAGKKKTQTFLCSLLDHLGLHINSASCLNSVLQSNSLF